MRTARDMAGKAADRTADVAISAVGNVAGATVAPKTALAQLRGQVFS